MATAKLENTRMTFSTGGTVLARMTATADTVTFVGDGGSNEVTLTNVKAPVLATDAATKGYVDSLVVSGVTWKNSANVATVSGNMTGSTYNSGSNTITWGGVPTIDGVVIASGNRIVVKDPAVTTGTNSTGIYEFLSVTQFNSSPAVTTPGTGYTSATGVATTSSGSGTGMIVTTTDDGFGGLASITITTQGSNYLNGDIVTVTGGTGGTFTLSDGELVLTRTADAAAADISNGSAIFVFSGIVNNDKSFVTTNDTSTTWGGGVTFSVMATAPPTAGSNTQVQYNNNNSFGASPNFTYNSGSNTLGLSGATSTIAGSANLNITTPSHLGLYGSSGVFIGIGDGDSWSFSTGGLISSNSGIGTIDGGDTLTLTGADEVRIDTSTNDWTFNGMILSSQNGFTTRAAVASNVALFDTTTTGTITIGNTTAGTGLITIAGQNAPITIGSATSTGAIILNNAAAMTIAANSTSVAFGSTNSTTTTLSGQTVNVTATTNAVSINTPTNNWTFNGGTLSTTAGFVLQAPATANVTLFNITTSGTITIGNAGATGAITIGGSTAPVTIGSTGATSNSIRGVSINVGSTETTALDLLARGTSGAAVLSAGTGATSGTVNINTVTATTATISGGAITIAAGAGNTTGAGGAVNITSGSGGTSGNGGVIQILASGAGVSGGNGGSVNIFAGSGPAGTGGSLFLVPGTGATVGTSGNIVLKLSNAGTSTATNNIIAFQNSAGTQIARVENTGDVYAATFNTTSDIKYKTNIEQLSDPLNQLKKIEGYSFNWKEDFVGYNDRLQYGVVAQQIEEAGLGHLVTGGNGSSKSVNYIGIIPLLIEAIKELSAKLEKTQIK